MGVLGIEFNIFFFLEFIEFLFLAMTPLRDGVEGGRSMARFGRLAPETTAGGGSASCAQLKISPPNFRAQREK